MKNYKVIVGIEDVILNNIDYCAEPHQLMVNDMIDAIDFEAIVKAVEASYDVQIDDREDFREFVEEVAKDYFYSDPSIFYI